MIFQIRLWRLLSFLLVLLDDNWIEESMRWFRISIMVCQKWVLDVHIAQYYKAIWAFNKCLFERWYS